MKKYLKLLSAIVLVIGTMFITSCGDDEGGKAPVVPPAPIKTISLDYDGTGADVERWEFFYDTDGRVESIDVYYNDVFDKEITYDYTVAGKLTIDNNGSLTVFDLDAEGRVIKEYWDPLVDDEYTGFVYNDDGFLTEIIEHYDAADHLKFEMTVDDDKNVIHRIRYEDDGVTVREDREFEYTIGDNASEIHQIYAVDSEWKWVGGVYGRQSEKLVDSFVRHITDDPGSSYGATYTYTFDTEDRVATSTKNGTSSGGPYTEKWTYTYYED